MTICPKCGLAKELCVCAALEKEKEKITVSEVPKRYGKMVTLVKGIGEDANAKDVLKELKTRLACGGTFKEGMIELQGSHTDRVKSILIRMGYAAEQIEVG
ncbi:MAG: stress response translation initiation inhibitor YciH [Candidatus Aenigmarchaeota archaeon]|nr:stress response translation initiation inhibitor YciH [Candidatus Aenigmarchaeota archaeon]